MKLYLLTIFVFLFSGVSSFGQEPKKQPNAEVENPSPPNSPTIWGKVGDNSDIVSSKSVFGCRKEDAAPWGLVGKTAKVVFRTRTFQHSETDFGTMTYRICSNGRIGSSDEKGSTILIMVNKESSGTALSNFHELHPQECVDIHAASIIAMTIKGAKEGDETKATGVYCSIRH